MKKENTLAALAALILTVVGLQQVLVVPPAYASAAAGRVA